jgi:hypothetical protein
VGVQLRVPRRWGQDHEGRMLSLFEQMFEQ